MDFYERKYMTKLIVTISLLVTSLVFIAVIVMGSQQAEDLAVDDNNQQIAQVLNEDGEEVTVDIFYWGTTCPHCHDVQEWMEDNAVEEKIGVISKEVYENQANSTDLTAKAKSCDLDTRRGVPVPFLYTIEGDCLIGTPDIIEYLEERISQ